MERSIERPMQDVLAKSIAPAAPNPAEVAEEFAKRREAALMSADYHRAELRKADRVADAMSQAMESLQMSAPENQPRPSEEMSSVTYRDRHG